MQLRTLERVNRGAVRAGFTLMELLVVVAILLVLTSVAVPLYMGYMEESKIKTARATAKMLASELQNFYVSNNGSYPQPIGDWSQILMKDGKNPPVDPWGNEFFWDLTQVGTFETQMLAPVVWSLGPDGQNGTGDDIYSNQ
jgi:general secretion pathway protein G